MGKLLSFKLTPENIDSLERFRKDPQYPEIMRASVTMGPDAVEIAYLKGRLHGLEQAHDLFTRDGR